MKQVKVKNGGTFNVREKGDPSPNPNGRPVGSLNRATVFRKYMDMIVNGIDPLTLEEGQFSNEERVVSALFAKAISGDTKAGEIILDSTYGKLTQTVKAEVEEVKKSYTLPDGSEIEL